MSERAADCDHEPRRLELAPARLPPSHGLRIRPSARYVACSSNRSELDRWIGHKAQFAYVRCTSILLKNSEIERRAKSGFRVHSVVYASRCHSKACKRVARIKTGRAADPGNFS